HQGDGAQGAVRAAVHGGWRERAGEAAAHEDKGLELKRPAHAVVARRAAHDDDVPPALIRADEVPPALPHEPARLGLRRTSLLAAPGLWRRVDRGRRRYGPSRLVPWDRTGCVEPGSGLLVLRVSDAAARDDDGQGQERRLAEPWAHGSLRVVTSSHCAPRVLESSSADASTSDPGRIAAPPSR